MFCFFTLMTGLLADELPRNPAGIAFSTLHLSGGRRQVYEAFRIHLRISDWNQRLCLFHDAAIMEQDLIQTTFLRAWSAHEWSQTNVDVVGDKRACEQSFLAVLYARPIRLFLLLDVPL